MLRIMMITQHYRDDLRTLLEQHTRFAIFGHDSPDGDAIGSMLGLWRLLEKQDKEVSYFAYPYIPRSFDVIEGAARIQTSFDYAEYDVLVFVDFSDYPRTHFSFGREDYFDQHKILVIDHHLWSTPKHALVFKDTEADSNCEWIFELTRDLRSDYYDEQVASYLYMGLLTDTGNFHHDKQWSRSLHNAAALVDLWADKAWLTQHFFGSFQTEQLVFLQQVLPKLVVNDQGIAYILYSKTDYESLGLEKTEAAWFLTSMVQKIVGLRFVLIARYDDASLKISFRSKDPDLSAEEIARARGGWGHFYAAGTKILLKQGQEPTSILQEIVDHMLAQ